MTRIYKVDNCYEQTDEAEKILLKLFAYSGRCTALEASKMNVADDILRKAAKKKNLSLGGVGNE